MNWFNVCLFTLHYCKQRISVHGYSRTLKIPTFLILKPLLYHGISSCKIQEETNMTMHVEYAYGVGQIQRGCGSRVTSPCSLLTSWFAWSPCL